jgi:hypothetical protein
VTLEIGDSSLISIEHWRSRSRCLEIRELSHKPELERQYGTVRRGLFGSAARDEMHEDSDIDILVTFNGPTTVARYFGLRDALESLLGRRVDLVTDSGLKERARPLVEKDLLDVA